ncbi:restriction endonuclease subunit S [Nocardia farcinica]|uniref:restriction endonuclease subunit S n=1 Tax=Nocardia farcinica TaxID=37329 RepID=UPI00189404C4|nr:restriction endonuclease subunit S [Nocardia farcinica]MBF6249490.1 restriction endonuclease subunit S [Nocardia farcinica]MBF6260810.1 restriction endonuclease subunit S [Nocardia farcinica]MBF6279520.1 restriction endonuclease subunit S [Nocardia farcinica]MBF6303820.1 restriction endonuclease subunit S [Nocardia farcinica]MBF6388862.1 restriction endonuclease subunit S [Nocardia farcinica]
MTSLPTAELGSVATINPRLSRPFEDDEMVSFLGMADVSEDGTTSAGIDRPFSDVRRGYTPFKNGDVLIAKITPCFENGKIVQADVTRDYGFGSTEFHVVRTGDGLDPRYLLHYLRRPSVRVDGERRMTGSGGQRRVPAEYVKNLRIPLPPIEEQRRIAAILDHADALRAKRREALARLDELTQSIFIDMFGDPVANPRGYAQVPLAEIGHLYSGGTPAKNVAENWTGSLPWFSPKDLKRDDLFDSRDHISESVPDRSSLKLLPPDTVVFVVRGMILAHSFPVSVLRVPATINQDMKAILPSVDVRVDYLASCLRVQAGHVLAQVSTAAHGTKRLDAEGMSQVSIPLPPIDEQDKFVEVIGNLKRLKSESSDSLGELDALFASLQSRAFRGEL